MVPKVEANRGVLVKGLGFKWTDSLADGQNISLGFRLSL